MELAFRHLDSDHSPRFPADTIDIWAFPLAVSADTLTALSDDERTRAERFGFARPREQFVAGRAALRTILGRYLGCGPRDVRLDCEPGGKPVIRGTGFHFNLSHTAGRAVLAVASRRVGIDVEHLREVPTAEGLVERFFAAEERAAFLRLHESKVVDGFFRGWTCKEALLKAVGRGLADLESCVVELDPDVPPRVARFDPGEWRLACWHPWPGFVAALAWDENDAGSLAAT